MRFPPLLVPALLAGSLGCSATVAGSAEAADAEASTSAAVIVVERTVGAGGAGNSADGVHSSAVARFVRMHGGAVDDEALRMVGAAVDFPSLGACSPTLARPATGSRPGRAVELVDVGAVTLEANGVRTNLLARRLPDVVDLVSGVVYTTRATEDEGALPARGVYVFRAAGAPELDVSPFAILATSPGEPVDLRVAGQDARSPFGVALAAGAPAELTWEASAIDDLVYVDVASSGLAPSSAVRCLFADTGRASLPSAAFGATTDSAADGTIAVHRLHREGFHAKGIDSGELRFDLARAVAFSRR